MKVDRTRFLLLTGSISAATALAVTGTGGCTIVTNDGAADAAPDVDPKEETADGGGTTSTDGGEGSDAAPAASCLGDMPGGDGGALDCASLEGDGCEAYCDHYAATYKPGVARAIVECLLTLPSCEGDLAQTKACVDGALAKACDDPSAKTFCEPVAASCAANGDTDEVDQASCEKLAKGLTEQGREWFLSCVDEGIADYCSPGSAYCLDAMK